MTALHIAELVFVSLIAVLFGLLKLSTNFRDLIGIRKDLLDIKKVKNDMVESESRNIPATDEDIKKFDPKRGELDRLIYDGGGPETRSHYRPRTPRFSIILLILAVLAAMAAFSSLFSWLLKWFTLSPGQRP